MKWLNNTNLIMRTCINICDRNWRKLLLLGALRGGPVQGDERAEQQQQQQEDGEGAAARVRDGADDGRGNGRTAAGE